MKTTILSTFFLCLYVTKAYAVNPEMNGCSTKGESIEVLSLLHATYKICGFDKKPKYLQLLKKIEQTNNAQCNFSANEITVDQEIFNNASAKFQKLSNSEKEKLCNEFDQEMQSTKTLINQYEQNQKPKYIVGSFDDPNIPGGYKQRCGMIVGHLNRTISDYQDAFYGKMPLDLMDEDRTIMSSDDSIPYTPYQIYDLDKKIKKLIFSDKKYASKLNTFMNNFKKQCLVDIQKYDKERTKRNSLHDYSKD